MAIYKNLVILVIIKVLVICLCLNNYLFTLYPNAAIHGHECIVELTPLTILLSSFLTELIPHWEGNSKYETFLGIGVISILLLDVLLFEFGSASELELEVVTESSDFSFGLSVVNSILAFLLK